MALNTLNTGAISFKKLSGKAHTQQGFAVTEEGISSNIQISYSTVFASPIESLPVTNSGLTTLYSTNGKVQRIKFPVDLIPNTQIGVNQSQGYRLKLPADWNTHPGALYPAFTAGTYLNAALGKLQIVPTLYGKLKIDGSTEYDPILYQTNGSTVITKFDPINWYLDPYNGVLFVQDPPAGYDVSASRPGFVEAFLYVGNYLDYALAHISGGTSGGTGTVTGATNGLTLFGKNIGLGGSITGGTLVDANGNFLQFGNSNSLSGGTSIYQQYSDGLIQFDLSSPEGQDGLWITDTRTIPKGIRYSGINYENDPHTLTSKAYVDAAIAGITGSTGTSVVTKINGTSIASTGIGAGAGTTGVDGVFLGVNAGNGVIQQKMVAIGYFAGDGATGAYNSNFIGVNAGQNATAADKSNFIGHHAGDGATNSLRSNFIGRYAGAGATNAPHSNFLGAQAGWNALNASNSIFIGSDAGNGATNAAQSIFIGLEAGISDTVDTTGSFTYSSILIGNNTKTNGFKNSIALGNNAQNSQEDQFVVGSTYTKWQIAGLDYVMPSGQSVGQLTNDGSGNLAWSASTLTPINGLSKVGSSIRLGGSMTGSSILDATAGGTFFNDLYVVGISGALSASNTFPASDGHYYLGGELLVSSGGNNRTAIVAYPQNNATGILITNETAGGYTGNLGVVVHGNNGNPMSESFSQPLYIIKKYFGARSIYDHTGSNLQLDIEGASGTGLTTGSFIRMNKNSLSLFEFTPAGEFKISGSTGSAGQVLKSGGAGNTMYWGTASGGSTVTASNGLHVSGSDVRLGGSLTADTTIAMSTHKFVMTGGTWNFTLDPVNNRLIAGSNCQVTGGTINYTFGDTNINAGVFGSVTFGELSEITSNVGDGMVCGEGSYVNSYGGKSFARSGAIRAGGDYGFIGGAFDNFAFAKTNLKSPQVAGYAGFGFYTTDGNQVNNHGVNAAASAILGGLNHNIPATSDRSAILGGNGIKAATGVTDTVYFPKVRIGQGIGAGLNVNNTNNDILVRNSATGEIEIRDAVTLISGMTSGGSQNIYITKKIVTGSTTLLTTDFVVFVNGVAPLTLTLPLAPNDGEVLKIKDVSGNALTNNITINGNGKNIDGSSTILINSNRGGVELCFDSTLNFWSIMNFIG